MCALTNWWWPRFRVMPPFAPASVTRDLGTVRDLGRRWPQRVAIVASGGRRRLAARAPRPSLLGKPVLIDWTVIYQYAMSASGTPWQPANCGAGNIAVA